MNVLKISKTIFLTCVLLKSEAIAAPAQNINLIFQKKHLLFILTETFYKVFEDVYFRFIYNCFLNVLNLKFIFFKLIIKMVQFYLNLTVIRK